MNAGEYGKVESDGDIALHTELARELGRLAEVFTQSKDEGRDPIARKMYELLEEVPRGNDEAIDEERMDVLRELTTNMTTVFARTGWTASEFRFSIGCDRSAEQLLHETKLDRCAELMQLLARVIDESPSDPDSNRLAVDVIVEAFRVAQGDSQAAHEFWDQRVTELGRQSARDFVSSGMYLKALNAVHCLAIDKMAIHVFDVPRSVQSEDLRRAG